VSDATGIGAASIRHSEWGTGFIDYANDGWKDLFVGQGHVKDNIELTQPDTRLTGATAAASQCERSLLGRLGQGGSCFR
jgi:hypothetical protein